MVDIMDGDALVIIYVALACLLQCMICHNAVNTGNT